MSPVATEVLDDAMAATRACLWPVVLREWLALAVVVFFVGTTSGVVGTVNGLPGGTVDVASAIEVDVPVSVPEVSLAPVAFGLAAVGLVAGVLFAVAAAVGQFVFVRQLTEGPIRLRGHVGASIDPGLRLVVLWVALAVGLAAVGLIAVVLTVVTFGLFALVLLALLPVLVAAAVAVWTFVRLTIDFVVPIMLVDERGVIDAWRRLLSVIREDWKPIGAYVVVRGLLGLVAGVVVAVAAGIIGVVLGVPVLLAGIVAAWATGAVSSTLAAGLAAAAAAVVALITLVVTTAVVGVPVQTYLRYYALFALAELAPRYDLLDSVRESMTDAATAGQ